MAWMDGIFKRFLRYWTNSEKGKEEKPSFWEEAIQREEVANGKRQEPENSKETKHIFYIEREKQDFKGKRKAETIPIFQKFILQREEIERFRNRPIFLQKEIPILQGAKEKAGRGIVETEQAGRSSSTFLARADGIFSFFEKGEKEEKRESVLQQPERTILRKDFFQKEKQEKSIFGIEEKEEAKERKEAGKSSIVREMEREYRTEELLQQIVQYKKENAQEAEQPKISVQIGQVQKSTDIDTIIAEITNRLWEARSVGRCSVERR